MLEPLKVRSIVNWHLVYRCLWDSKMEPMVRSRLPPMLFKQPAIHIIFYRSRNKVWLRFSEPRGIPIAM